MALSHPQHSCLLILMQLCGFKTIKIYKITPSAQSTYKYFKACLLRCPLFCLHPMQNLTSEINDTD